MNPKDEFDRNCPHGHLTRDRNKARILGEINDSPYCLVAAITLKDGRESVYLYTESGKRIYNSPYHPLDLINAPTPKKRVTGWQNLYNAPDGTLYVGAIHSTQEEAQDIRHRNSDNCIACIHFDVEEGEGL